MEDVVSEDVSGDLNRGSATRVQTVEGGGWTLGMEVEGGLEGALGVEVGDGRGLIGLPCTAPLAVEGIVARPACISIGAKCVCAVPRSRCVCQQTSSDRPSVWPTAA